MTCRANPAITLELVYGRHSTTMREIKVRELEPIKNHSLEPTMFVHEMKPKANRDQAIIKLCRLSDVAS